MIFLFYCLLCEIKSDIPRWGVIKIDPTSEDHSTCSDDDKRIKSLQKKCSEYPSKYGGSDLCNKLLKPYAGYKCFKGDDESAVSSALSKVDSSIELLYVQNSVLGQKIDFNKLPTQMIVVLSETYIHPQKLSFIELDNNVSNSKSSKLKPKEEVVPVRIVGNIKDKVSSLIITGQEYQIVDSDLNVDNLILAGALFNAADSPKKIIPNTIISEISSQNIKLSEKIESKHFGYYNSNEKISAKYTISFLQNEMGVSVDDADPYYIDYCEGPQLDLIINANDVTFYVDDYVKIPENAQIKMNITIKYYSPAHDPTYFLFFDFAKLLAKKALKIHTGGNWNLLTQKPDITITYDKNEFELDASELQKVADVKESDLFIFKTNYKEKKKKNVGLIVGVTIGCVAAVAIIVVVVVLVIRMKKKVNSGELSD